MAGFNTRAAATRVATIILCLDLLHRTDATEWIKLNSQPVCFSAIDKAKYGSFNPPNIEVSSFKLVHLSGQVSCDVRHFNGLWSKWGCGNHPSDQSYRCDALNVVITDSNNTLIVPSNPKWTRVEGYWYTLQEFNCDSPCIVLNTSSPYRVSSAAPLRVWYGELLKSFKTNDNDGTACIDVYAEVINVHEVVLESNGPVKSKDDIIIGCRALAVDSTDLSFSWFKDGKKIVWGSRWKIDSNNFISVLTVRDARTEDGGWYSCSVSKGNKVSNTTFVTVWPTLELLPAIATRQEDEDHTIACEVSDRRFSTVIVERLSDGVIVELARNSTVVISNLRVPEGESVVDCVERKFLCMLTSEPGVQSSDATLIIIKQGQPTCNDEIYLGVPWRKTIPGKMDVRPCPGKAKGTVTRRCESVDGKAQWSRDVNFLNCATETFLRLSEQITALNDGFRPNLNVSGILATLAGATEIGAPNLQQPIYGRDLELSVATLSKILQYNINNKNSTASDEKSRDNFMSVGSNLLDPVNAGTWRQLRKIGKNKDRDLIGVVDKYGLQVASLMNGTKTQVVSTTQTKNIGMQISSIRPKSLVKVNGLSFKLSQTSISLPAEVFRSKQPIKVVNVVYLTLSNIFQLGVGNLSLNEKWNKTKGVNTTIVSSIVSPPPRNNLKSPVKIVLQNTDVTSEDAVGMCVFWKPSLPPYWADYGCRRVPEESNNEITTCACNHLTIFAALFDPYGAPVSAKDQKYLELISVVGCSISLLAVLLTIAVNLFFWRKVKSPRTIVLVNLCLAIAGSCVLIISEGWARGALVACTIVAALLHFFLLAVFAWMLCEGSLLYILLIQVFGGSANEKVKYFLSFGWCFPAVVVGISLGVTRLEGYGTKGETCWLSVESGLIWAFVGPAVFIILVNTLVFVLVFRQMMTTHYMLKKPKARKLRLGVKATAVILPMLGITWILGLLALGTAAVAIKYLFAIFNSLQGLMIFIFHCVLNKEVRDAFKHRYQTGVKKSFYSAQTKSETARSPTANQGRRNMTRNPQETMGLVYSLPTGNDVTRVSLTGKDVRPTQPISVPTGNDVTRVSLTGKDVTPTQPISVPTGNDVTRVSLTGKDVTPTQPISVPTGNDFIRVSLTRNFVAPTQPISVPTGNDVIRVTNRK